MLKKIMATVIVFTMFCSTLTSASYGLVKSSILTKTEAEKLAKEKLSIENDYKLQYSNLHTRDRQQKQFWNLEFEKPETNISITMAADSGEIISFSQWNRQDYGRAVALIEEEAKKAGIDFIKALEPKRFKETEEVTVKTPTVIPYDSKINYIDNNNYHFMFVRKVNGEFFPNNYFTVTVSGVSGNVISYEMKWDNASYTGNSQLLSEEKIRDLFEKEDNLKLKYVRLDKYNEQDRNDVVLTPVYIYVPKESDKIDAITGRLLSFNEIYNSNYYGYPTYDRDGAVENEMKDETASGGVAEMIPEEGVISKEKAEQIVVNTIKDHLDIDEIKLNSSSYTNYYRGLKGKFWNIYWYSNEGAKYLRSVVDAETGKVIEISYNKSKSYEPIQEPRVLKNTKNIEEDIKVYEDTIDLIEQKIKSMFPATKGQLNLKLDENSTLQKDNINILSHRYINNIPFEDNYVNINYNIETQEINNLSYAWYDVELKQDASILNKEKANEIFYNKVGFEKYLVQLKDLDKHEQEGLDLPKKELAPVYGIKNYNFAFINAVTGKALTYSGEEFIEEAPKTSFTDISDSPYEKAILLMDKMGVLQVSEKTFKPEEALLRKDAIKWLIEIGWSNRAYNLDNYYNKANDDNQTNYFKDISKDNPYYKYIEAAVDFGIIENTDYFNPDDEISKIDLAKWIINAMNQKDLASYSSIFKVPYKDADLIKTEDIGYVALSKYYNIFGDKNIEEKFEADKNFIRGEFIHNMYQLIKQYKDI